MSKQYDNERWLPVVGYEDCYEVSNLGRLRSLDRMVMSRSGRLAFPKRQIIKAQQVDRLGYVKVVLHRDGRQKHTTMHRVVATAFVDLKPGKQFVNHIDGNKANNRASNLEWCSAKENVQHAVRMQLFGSSGERHHLARLTNDAVLSIRSDRAAGVSLKQLSVKHGVSVGTISAAATGRTWRSV